MQFLLKLNESNSSITCSLQVILDSDSQENAKEKGSDYCCHRTTVLHTLFSIRAITDCIKCLSVLTNVLSCICTPECIVKMFLLFMNREITYNFVNIRINRLLSSKRRSVWAQCASVSVVHVTHTKVNIDWNILEYIHFCLLK
jgi:hypothetical protein